MVVTEQQGFSKQKIIKNYFTATMAQKRLDGLSY
jgi:hypothetical protein